MAVGGWSEPVCVFRRDWAAAMAAAFCSAVGYGDRAKVEHSLLL